MACSLSCGHGREDHDSARRGQRRGDGAETVMLCNVDNKKPTEAADDKKKSKKEAKAEPAEQAKAE